MKKAKIAARRLDVITREINEALRAETVSIVQSGNLLIEAKAQIAHGDWLPWLENNFDLTDRTARNYMRAAEFAAQIGNDVSDLNISPTVLYALASGVYEPEVIASILEQAKERRVDQKLADKIIWSQQPGAKQRAEAAAAKAKQEAEAADEAEAEVEAVDEAEAEAILDGAPPELPPAEPAEPVDHHLLMAGFNEAVAKLKRLSTKPADKFRNSIHSAADIEAVAEFLFFVADTKHASTAKALVEVRRVSV
jgi:hypothetical protein